MRTGQLKVPSSVKMEDALGKTIRFDASTEAMEIIDYGHHEIHAGSHYAVAGQKTMGSSEVLQWYVTVPASNKEPHMLWGIEGSKNLTFEVFEGATATGGESKTPVNSNRRSSNTSILTVKQNPTVTASGELLEATAFGTAGGNKLQASGGGGGREDEMILKSNTNYLFRLTSGAADNVVAYRGSWYEHTPRG